MGSLTLPIAARGLDACGFVPRSLIIWDKGHIVFGRGHYHWRHEACWYAVKKGAQANWTGDRKASTVWEINKSRKSETGHSAQKPVECMQRAIHNHQGDVYDPIHRVWHHTHCRRAREADRLRHRDRACLRGCVGQAVGGVHRPEGRTVETAINVYPGSQAVPMLVNPLLTATYYWSGYKVRSKRHGR